MKKKLLSLLLTLSLLIPMMSPVSALEADNKPQQAATFESTLADPVPTDPLTPDLAENKIELDLESAEIYEHEALTADNLPLSMSLADAKAEGFVSRVKGAESDLNSVVFGNRDGTLTLYYYRDPVKYVDELGQIRDKSNRLYAYKDGSFGTISSDIKTDFPKKLTDGITMRKDDFRLHMAPTDPMNATGTISSDQTVVTYALNDVTRYEYSLTAMGFKEDIVVSEYTGQTEYSFNLKTYGLTPVNDNGTYILVDSDGVHRATLGDIIIFTADERNNTFGELIVQEITASQEYRLVIRLDTDWLADEKTAYPIIIDPTLTYANTVGNIEDLVVGTSTTYSGTASSLYVGRGSSGAKIRTLMRFPNLNILGYNVTSATVSIRDLLCQSAGQPVECYEYLGNNWSESSTIAWAGMGGSPVGSYIDGRSVSYVNGNNPDYCAQKHRYVFNITTLARKWAAGTASPAKGVIFKATDDYEANGSKTFKTFASINRGGDYIPDIAIQYELVAGSIEPEQTRLKIGETVQYSCQTTPTSTITWYSSNTAVATVSSNGTVTALSQGYTVLTATWNGGSKSILILVGELDDGTYFIGNKGTGKYMDVEGPSTAAGTNIQQWEFLGQIQSRWIITLQNDGYYTIQSAQSNKYVGIEDITEGQNAAVKQYTYDRTDDTQRWSIIKTDSGGYKLVPKAGAADDLAIAVPTSGTFDNGTDLVLYYYTGNANYRDEWVVNRLLPTSGYELDYTPSLWSDYVENCCNCYAYAINNQVYPGTNFLWFKQQMGYYKGAECEYKSITEEDITEAVENDYDQYNSDFNKSLYFAKIGRLDTCPAGTYKIALVASNDDYHWYRQDSDGLWSHKLGLNPVQRTDNSGNLIVDPSTADRGKYTEFLGFFAVSPWGNLLDVTSTVYCYRRGEIYTYEALMKEIGLNSVVDLAVVTNVSSNYDNKELETLLCIE